MKYIETNFEEIDAKRRKQMDSKMTTKQLLASKHIVLNGYDKPDHPPITAEDVGRAYMEGFDKMTELMIAEIQSTLYLQVINRIRYLGEEELPHAGQ